jgi:hypothetical protein
VLSIEAGLALVAVVVAFAFPNAGSCFLEQVERAFSRLARRRALAVAVVGLTALALRAALLPVLPVPEPSVHDEFGYLLAADTFAHGRLTNPTHPMWAHFQTFSVIQKPTYQCFAQPAQGLILAAGKKIAGHPFWGVWFSVGLMCAAICWMLQGWLAPVWALVGGLFAVLRFGVFSYWGDSYWGGALGAFGGALVLGALPRIKRHQRLRDVTLMGLGLAVLANNRPYEGFLLSLLVGLALFAWLVGKDGPPGRAALRHVILPLCLLLAVTAAGTGYYSWRVTGSPFRLPYQVERETYAVAPYMVWQHLRPQPTTQYGSEQLRRVYVNGEPTLYRVMRTPLGFAIVAAKKAWVAWQFYLGPILTAPLVMLLLAVPYGFSWRRIDTRVRFLLLTLAASLFGLALELPFSPHYASPLTALVLALVLLAMRRLRVWHWRHRPTGLCLVRAITVICLIMFALRVGAKRLRIPLAESYQPGWSELGPQGFGRAGVLAQLHRLPGRQLVIVRYSSHHDFYDEWVYNDADIEASKVVWAREMNRFEDQKLVRYFKNRNVWLLEADGKPPTLTPYPVEGSPMRAAGDHGSLPNMK